MIDVAIANRLKPTVELYLKKCRAELINEKASHENLVRLSETLRTKWLTELEHNVRQTEPSLGATNALLDNSTAAEIRTLWNAIPHYINRIERPVGVWEHVTKRAVAGTASGAAIGSVIPIAGTVLGAGVGTWLGFAYGLQTVDEKRNNYYGEVLAQNEAYFSKFSEIVLATLTPNETPTDL